LADLLASFTDLLASSIDCLISRLCLNAKYPRSKVARISPIVAVNSAKVQRTGQLSEFLFSR
jgi:hypothetical protein